MDKFIYFSFCEADRQNALTVAEQIKADGYQIRYDDGSLKGEVKDRYILDIELSAFVCLIYLTDNYLKDKDAKRDLYFLESKDKELIFLLPDRVFKDAAFEKKFIFAREINVKETGGISNALASLYEITEVSETKSISEDERFPLLRSYRSLTRLDFSDYPELTVFRKERVLKEAVVERAENEIDVKRAIVHEDAKEDEKVPPAVEKTVKTKASLKKEDWSASRDDRVAAGKPRKSLKMLWAAILCIIMLVGGGSAIKNLQKNDGGSKINLKKGDTITLGHYPQTADGEEKPIEWEVLSIDGEKALLLSKTALDVIPYNEEYEDITWEECTLRKWMNETFYEGAFTESERDAILTTKLENADNESYGTKGGNPTEDKVFCLSLDEVNQYCENDKERQRIASAYAMTKTPWTSDNYGDAIFWWLRSPGDISAHTSAMLPSGEKSVRGYSVHDRVVCVCPALYVDLAKLSS